jgi:dTDP-D-glucose 4,6-dehydratase
MRSYHGRNCQVCYLVAAEIDQAIALRAMRGRNYFIHLWNEQRAAIIVKWAQSISSNPKAHQAGNNGKPSETIQIEDRNYDDRRYRDAKADREAFRRPMVMVE